jgi:exodeoxyribonuclease VII large subunit
MPEIVSDKTIFSLLEVMKSIQNVLTSRYSNSYWIKAEMNKLNFYVHSGHCYPDLVEKQGGKVIAQMRSIIWKDDFARINSVFLNTVKEPLKDGIKILFCAKVSFDPVYGLNLHIIDIDPSYSLGDLEKEKAETIQFLKKEGIFDSNKLLPIAKLPQRIAIISVETSKGYADFMNILNNNAWNYKYFTMLFPALLQGEKAVDSIINQLHRIKKAKSHFDVVAIVRGGGGDVGLSCYNHRLLTQTIALFPLPVITGIGHSTNATVAEMISYKNAITPTELADYLLQKFHNFSVPVNNAQDSINRNSKNILGYQNIRFEKSVNQFKSEARNFITSSHYLINNQIRNIQQNTSFILQRQHESHNYTKFTLLKHSVSTFISQRLLISNQADKLSKFTNVTLSSCSKNVQNLAQLISILNPENVLKRGYSITLQDGKSIKSIENVHIGSSITTILSDGTIISNTVSIAKNKNK